MNKPSPYLFDKVSIEAWDALVADSPQSTVFNSRKFLSSIGNIINYWGVFNGEKLLSALSIQTDSEGSVQAPTVGFNLYSGVLFSSEVTNLPYPSKTRRELSIIEILLVGLTGFYPNIWLSLHPSFYDVRALQWFNYHEPEKGQFNIDFRYTSVLELKEYDSRDQLVSTFAKGRKSDYKKAIKNGITISTSKDISLLIELNKKTFSLQDVDHSYLDSILLPVCKSAIDMGYGELIVAFTNKGIPTSAAFFVWDNTTSYYLFGASDPAYRSNGATSLVMTECIWRSKKLEHQYVDFVGINSPQRGEFKGSFGGSPTLHFDASWKQPYAK